MLRIVYSISSMKVLIVNFNILRICSPFSFSSLRDVIKGKADKEKENSEEEFHLL